MMPSAIVAMIQPASDLVADRLAHAEPLDDGALQQAEDQHDRQHQPVAESIACRSDRVRPTSAPSISASPWPKFSVFEVAKVS